MRIVRSLGFVVMKQNSVVSVVRDFILRAVKVKQCSERNQRYHFKSSESKNTIVSVFRYFILVIVNCNRVVSVVRDFILTVVNKDSVVSIVSEVKQRSERSQRFLFNSSKSKTT